MKNTTACCINSFLLIVARVFLIELDGARLEDGLLEFELKNARPFHIIMHGLYVPGVMHTQS